MGTSQIPVVTLHAQWKDVWVRDCFEKIQFIDSKLVGLLNLEVIPLVMRGHNGVS